MQATFRKSRGSAWQRAAAWALSAIVVAVFVAANAHLVAVSLATQPDCVAPETSPAGGAAPLRAAKPSC